MKRLILLILTLCLLITSASADYDRQHMKEELQEMTDDELLDFYIEYQMISAGRGLFLQEGIMLYPGLYEIGVDIPEGNYYFKGVKDAYSCSIHVYPSSDKMGSFDDIQNVSGVGYTELSAAPQTGKFILKEGNIIKLVQGPAYIFKWQGIMP